MKKKKQPKKRLCIVLTAGVTFGFYENLIPYFIARGWEITTVSGTIEEIQQTKVEQWGARTVTMPLVRRPALFIDLWCLFRLWWFFFMHNFDVVQVSSPKAGLLASIAARLAGQKVVFSIIGRAYENYTGWKRRIYVFFDQISCFCANLITTESESLMDAIVADRCCQRQKIVMGTHFDINENYFDSSLIQENDVISFRNQLGIPKDHTIFLYVGRLNYDKGIYELVSAFIELNRNDTELLMIGSKDDESNLIPSETWETIEKHPRIHAPGPLSDPRIAYAASDVFVCPTYRESLSVVVLEASLMLKPVITTDAIGARDSIVDGITGIIVPKMTVHPLAKAMLMLSEDLELCKKMGYNGRNWVVAHFGNQIPTKRAYAFFEEFIR